MCKHSKKWIGNWKTWKPYDRWVVTCLHILRLKAAIAFQVFIKHTAVISRRILKYSQMSSRAVLHVEGMYFSDFKNETKN
jgi:hypothetical protein